MSLLNRSFVATVICLFTLSNIFLEVLYKREHVWINERPCENVTRARLFCVFRDVSRIDFSSGFHSKISNLFLVLSIVMYDFVGEEPQIDP